MYACGPLEITALTGVGAGFIATVAGDETTDGDVTGADATGVDVAGVDVAGVDVTGVDVTGVDVTGDVTAGVEGDGLDVDEPPSPPPPPQPNNVSGAMSNVIRMDFDNPQHCDCAVLFLCSVLDWLGNRALFEFWRPFVTVCLIGIFIIILLRQVTLVSGRCLEPIGGLSTAGFSKVRKVWIGGDDIYIFQWPLPFRV